MNNGLNNYDTVDERIVEMRIDNTQFENGAKKTIRLLEKLDKALHLHAETDEIDKLTDAVGKFDVSPMANGLDTLQRHFSALEIAGMRVMSNLTDSVYNFTAKTIKDFTVAPVMQGWEKFGDKTTAVATLKAQGYELEKVNKLMEDLNWFTDETSYNFTDMVGNIAKFTATGQDLDKSVTAMEGIALWAALSGQNATKASMAMYQLSQAMGKGALKYDDYKSIQNASMDTIEFRQQAVAAAEALGKLRKVGEDTWTVVGGGSKDEAKALKLQRQIRDAEVKRQYAQERLEAATTVSSMRSAKQSVEQLDNKIQDLNEDLANLVEGGSKGAFTLSELFSSDALSRQLWFTDEVMMSVFNNYAKGIKEIQRYMDDNDIDTASIAMQQLREEAEDLAQTVGITLDEAFKQLGYDIDEFSLKAFEAGQQARTWKDVVDSVKDAVSTGWMNTFEIIFGNADKATKFWTNMSNQFWNLFASGGESRNSILKVAMGTADSIKEIAEYVSENTSFSPKTGEAVQEFDKVTSSIKTMQDTAKATPLAWSDITKSLDALGVSGWELGHVLSEIESFTKPGTIFDNQLGGIKWEINDLEKAFNSGAISIQDFQAAIAVLNDASYLPVLRKRREARQVGDFTWSDMDEKSMQKELNIIAEYLVKFGRDTEMHAKMQEAWNKGWNEDWDLSRWKNAIENAEQNVQEFSNLSAWEKLERELNQNGKTLEDFQDSLNQILYENKSVELNALIEKYGSLEEALKSGEIEAGELYEALVQLRSGNGVNDATAAVEENAQTAIKSLEDLKEVALGVIRGDYGNGEDRRKALESLGYNYDLIQGIAEIMYNGGQGYIGVTEELLRNEYPTFYAMMQEQLALNSEYEDSWNGIINSEADAAELLNEFQTDLADANNSTYSPKTNGTETAMDGALEAYQAMLKDLEVELEQAYIDYADIEQAIAENGIAGYEGALRRSAERIEEISDKIDKVNTKIKLLGKIGVLNHMDIEGYELFTNSLNRILEIFVKIKETADEAVENVFGDEVTRGLKLKLALSQFHNFVNQLTMSEDAISGVRTVFEGFFTVVRLGGRVVSLVARAIGSLSIIALRFIDKFFSLIGRFSNNTLISSIDDLLDILTDLVDIFTDSLDSIINSQASKSFFTFLGDIFANIAYWFGVAKDYALQIIDFLEPVVGLLLMALAGITSFAASHVFTAITAVFKAITSLPSSIVNFVSSSQLLSSIWSGISTIIDKIKKNLQKGWEFVRGIFENRGFTEALKGLSTWASDMLGKVFPNLVSAFENFNIKFTGEGNIFQSILTGITSGLTGIGGLFVVVFGGLLNLITGLVKGLQGVNFNTDKIAEGFNDFYEIVKLIFNGLFGDATEFKERIANFVTNAWEGFKESMEQISIRDALKALRLSFVFMIGTKILSVLSMVKKIGEEAASIPESITGAIKSGGRVLDSIAKSFQANAIIKMAVATTIVAMALYGLSKIPEDKLTHAAAIISVVMIIMTLLAKAFNSTTRFQSVNIKKFSVFGELGSALLGLGIAIAAFARAVFKIGNMEHPERLIPAVGSIIAFIGSIILLAGIFAAYFTKSTMNWERLKAVGMIMGKLGWSIMLLSLSIGNLIAPVFAFTAAAALLEKYNLSTWNLWGSIIAVSAIILTLAIGLRMLIDAFGKIKDDEAIKRTGGSILKMGAGILLISIAISGIVVPILVLTAVFAKLNSMPNATTSVLWQAFGMVAGILGSFLIFFATLALITRKMNGSQLQHLGGSMLKMGASILLISFALKSVVFSILEVIAVFALFEKKGWAFDYTKALIIIGSIAGGLLAFAAVLGAISLMPFKSTKLLAMAAVFMALGMAMLFITPLILLFTAAVAAILYYTKDIVDFGDSISRMGKVAGILLLIGAAALVFGAGISFLGSGVLKAAAAILLLSVSVNVIVKAIEALVTHQDDLSAFWKKLNNWLTADNIWKLGKIAALIAVITLGILALVKGVTKLATVLKLINVSESLGTKFSNIFKTLGLQFPQLFKKVGNYLITHKAQVMEALIWMIGIIGGYISGLIPTMVEQLMNAITELLNSLRTSLQRNRSVLVDSIAGIANIIIDIFAEVLKKTFSSLFSGEEWVRNPIANAIKAGFGTLSAIKLATALINLFFAGSRLGTLFKGAGAATAKGGASSAVQVAAQVATNAATTGGTVNLAQNSINGIGEAVSTAVGDTVGESISGATKTFIQYIIPIATALGIIAMLAYGIKRSIDFQEDREDKAKHEADKAPTKEARQTMLVDVMNRRNQSDLHFANPTQLTKDQRKQLAKDLQDKETEEELIRRLAKDAGGFIDEYTIKQLVKKYKNNGWADEKQVTSDIENAVKADTNIAIDDLRDRYKLTEEQTKYLSDNILEFIKYLETGSNFPDFIEKLENKMPLSLDLYPKDVIEFLRTTSLALDEAFDILNIVESDLSSTSDIEKAYNEIKAAGLDLERVQNIHSQYEIPWSTIKETMQQTGMSLSDTVALAEYLGNEFNSGITDATSQYLSAIKEAGISAERIRNLQNKGISFWDAFIRSVQTGIGLSDTMTLLETMGKSQYDSVNDVAELQRILDDIKAFQAKQIEEAKATSNDILAESKKLAETTPTYIDENVTSALSTGDYKGAAKAFASSFIPSIIDGDALVAEIDQALAGHPEVADILNKNIAASGLGNNISEAVNNAVKNGIDTAKISEVISNSLAEAQKDPQIASEMSNFISNFMPLDSDKTLLADSYGSLAKDAMGGYVNTLLGSLLPVYGANAQIAKAGQNAIMDTNDSHSPSRVYMGFGKNAVDGLVIGIRNNLQAAYNAGVALANSVNEGYRRTLKINSPSKVFEAMSRYIPEGVAVGINNNQEPAITAIVGLGKAVIEAAHRTMAQVSYVASDDFNFQPSITPVIDFGEIRAGASNLSSIFSRNATDVNVRPHGRYSDVNMPETAMSYTMTNQNRDVVNEIHRLSDLMSQLGEEITNMKIVLNSGVLVGEMAPQMNNRLGVLAQRERRQ